MRYSLVVLVALLLVSISALSEKSDANQSSADQQKKFASKTSRSSKDTSSLEKAIRESIKEASEKPDAYADEKSKIDRQIAEYTRSLSDYTESLSLYTLWLAVGTTVLAVVAVYQGVQLRRSAIISERALIDLEAPYVIMDIVSSGIVVDSEGRMSFVGPYRFKYQFSNYGRTPAILSEILTDFSVRPDPDMPMPIDPRNAKGRTFPAGIVAAPGSPYQETGNLLAAADITKLLKPDAWTTDKLWFTGYLQYSDIFGRSYTLGFCAVFDPLGQSFVKRGDERYNYATRPSLSGRRRILKRPTSGEV